MENKRLVMIPGPTPVVDSIRREMGREVAAFGDPGFVADYKSLIEDLKALWGTQGEVFPLAGSGTLAMEMAIANITRRGDSVLVVSHGYFGDRYADLCRRKGLEVDVLQCPWGEAVPLAQIDAQLSQKSYTALTVTHVDTATGVCAPVESIGAMVREKHPDTLFVVDGVCATGAEREKVDAFGIDVLFTGSQKAFGVPPGMFILWAGPRALERRNALGDIPEYYVDFKNWLPTMADPAKYFATPPVNMVWALKEAVEIIKKEGMFDRFARHKKNSCAVREGLALIGLLPLAQNGYQSVALSCFLYPEGVDDAAFRAALLKEGVMVAGGLGDYAGKLFRLGHMGNADVHELGAVVAAVERALYAAGKTDLEFGKALGKFNEHIARCVNKCLAKVPRD